jgi:AcrR family transcriptional regulator
MPTTAAAKSPDHRPRVAAERRERMRRRLIESALIVFADKGVGASIIPDVVAAAEVSQGSFYNYFRTNEDLLAAVSDELSAEMVQLIEPAVGDIADPALRVATAMRCYLHLARSQRLLARFLAAAGLRVMSHQSAVFRYLPADVEEGQKDGSFAPVPLDIVLDVVAGAGLVVIDRMARGRVAKDYPEKVVAAMLRMLGMTVEQTERVLAPALPKLVPAADSLLARAQARSKAQDAAAV